MARASVRLGPHEERRLAGLPLGAWKALRFRDRKELEGDSVQVTAAGGARLEWK